MQCPYCWELLEIYVEPDLRGQMVQDCEVCCRPWSLAVSHDEDGNLSVHVERLE